MTNCLIVEGEGKSMEGCTKLYLQLFKQFIKQYEQGNNHSPHHQQRQVKNQHNYVTEDSLCNVFCKFWILLFIKFQYSCKRKRIRCHTWYGNENWRFAQANKSATKWNLAHWTGASRKSNWTPGLNECICPSGPRILVRAVRLRVTILVRTLWILGDHTVCYIRLCL